MSRQSIQKIKAMLLCIEYDTLFVDTVDTYTGVCGSYTTPYAGVKTLHKVASCPCQEGRLLYCVSLPSWGFSCSPVWGGSFVNFLGLVKLQGWLQARRTANPQFLKLKGAQQPGNSYISMGTKLHPPHSNKLPACTEFWSEKCLQCLKTVGLYNSFGGGRFSFWQSLLTWASRCANSQASASNAGLPGDPNSPESNCSYLALILSVKELYSLCASCTVNK